MTRQRVVVATRNPGKVAELGRILSAYDVELVGLEEFPDAPDVAETGETFAENALLKARAAAEAPAKSPRAMRAPISNSNSAKVGVAIEAA